MAKTLSTYNATAADKPQVDLVRLVQISFAGSSPAFTIYLCDRVFGSAGSICEFNGVQYDPLLIDIATVRLGTIDAVDYNTGEGSTELTLDNTTGVGGAANLTTLFATYDPHYATVIISELFNGAASPPDRMDIFKGQIEDIISMDPAQVILSVTAYELAVNRKFSHTIVDDSTYPGADPDDIGKMVPIVYGRAKRVPCIAIDAGSKTTVIDDMSESAPGNSDTLEVTDAGAFPASGAFTIQIDNEQIRIASRSGNILTLAASDARGYNDTFVTYHDAGAMIAEVQSEYIYLAADHEVSAINDVYVDGIRQNSSVYESYTGGGADSYTKLLLHCDGSHGGKVFTDSSPQEHTITDVDDVYVSTAEKKFGSGSALFDGSGDWLEIADSDDWYFGSGAFTVDFWIYFNDISNNVPFFSQYTGSGDNLAFYGLYTGSEITDLQFQSIASSVTEIYWTPSLGSSPLVTGQWYHIALIRGWNNDPNTYCITVNGQSVATTTDSSSLSNQSAVLRIGRFSSYYVSCYMDEFRISKGIARWTENFTPQSAAYPSANSKAGYEGKAAIVFPVLPTISKQVNVEIDSAARSAADAGHNHSGSYSYLTWYFDTATNNTAGNPTGSSNLVDGSITGSSGLWFNAGYTYRVTCDDSSPPSPGGTPIRYKICVAVGSNSIATISYNSVFRVNFGSPSHIFRLDFADLTAGAGTVFQSGWYTCSTSEDSWAELGALGAVAYWETGTGQLRINEVYIYVEYYTSAPDGYAAVSLSGQSFVIGNTIAETVIGRRVTADVDGAVDDGSIIGSPAGQLIERPDYILAHIWQVHCGLSTTEIDSTSYAAAGSFYNTNSYRLAFVLLQRPNVQNLANRIARQSISLQFWEAGVHYLVDMDPDAAYSADHSIEANFIDLDQIHISYTPRARIDNTLTARYDHRWDGSGNIEDDQAIVTATDATSVTKYGTLTREESLPYIIDSAMAQDVLDWMLADWADPRLVVEFSGGWALTAIERGDIIAFTAGAGDDYEYLQAALLGLVSFDTDLFRVLDMQRRSDSAIQITAVKI